MENTKNDQLAILWEQYLSGRMSRAERTELRLLLQDPALQHYFEELIKDQINVSENGLQTDPKKEEHIRQVLAGINRQTTLPVVHRVHFLQRKWWGYAAAIVLLLGAGTWLVLSPAVKEERLTFKPVETENILPGSEKATLTLADGSVILLDSAVNGAIAHQGSTQIVKLNDGNIAYNNDGSLSATPVMNTMRTPTGGQYKLTLPDGTKVWLNAASSITFPVVFAGKEREVKITGEVYFEVAHDKTHPFLVKNNNTSITVLGTHFDVNAYEDEADLKVTLIEGSVKVTEHMREQATILVPGQQAQLSATQLKKHNNVDISKVMAWKNGLFNFEDVPFDEVMRQISRWYDVKIIYPKNIPNIQLWGKMSRNTSFAGLLNNLEDVGVKYSLDKDKRELILLP